MILVVVKNTLS